MATNKTIQESIKEILENNQNDFNRYVTEAIKYHREYRKNHFISFWCSVYAEEMINGFMKYIEEYGNQQYAEGRQDERQCYCNQYIESYDSGSALESTLPPERDSEMEMLRNSR